MNFTVVGWGQRPVSPSKGNFYLLADNWDDFGYKTLYTLTYVPVSGEQLEIGQVKIARFGLGSETGRPTLPTQFESLPDGYFSLGQDDGYYSQLNELTGEVSAAVLTALKDIAIDPDLFEQARVEEVVKTSLMRFVTASSVTGQLHRLAHGGARVTDYAFSFTPPHAHGGRSPELPFAVTAESEPPTNIHVIIGRNGVGKTRLLQFMARALVEDPPDPSLGTFDWGEEGDSDRFANLVYASFSAFDAFEPPSNLGNQEGQIRQAYIGLKQASSPNGPPRPPKSPEQLSDDFVESVQKCSSGARTTRWLRAMKTLETDPIFHDAEVSTMIVDADDTRDGVIRRFQRLSSGHKLVLLTVTRLVELVEERSLVLLDEPEAHLHPPLLSAFVRCLSDLLLDRNGVAIIATHSPVVLQEVPRTCVWKLQRSGDATTADRPEIETFGENVGVLTREIFGLEVTQSGFHRLLEEAVARRETYEKVIEHFGGQLGGEARAIARALTVETPQQRMT